MDLQFFGANCLTLTYQGLRVVVDDNLAALGAKSVTKAGDVALFTSEHAEPAVQTKLTIDYPGEYEIASFSIYGIPARAHMDEAGRQSATIYRIVAADVRILIAGHIFPKLSDDELERIGIIDVLVIPVGGNGYTLDPIGALELIKAIEPKMVIPTHYADDALTYPMPQQDLEQALKGLAMEPAQTITKLKLKSSDLSDGLQLVVLEKP